jgi:hypothetical protein
MRHECVKGARVGGSWVLTGVVRGAGTESQGAQGARCARTSTRYPHVRETPALLCPLASPCQLLYGLPTDEMHNGYTLTKTAPETRNHAYSTKMYLRGVNVS